MCTLATIGVDNNLSSSQSGISVGTANDKLTRGIDIIFDVVAKQVKHLFRMYLGLDTRDEDVDDVLANLLEHTLVVSVELIVLRRDHNGIDTLGYPLVTVLNRHLALGIRTQVGHHLAFLADVSQRTHDEMCQVQ